MQDLPKVGQRVRYIPSKDTDWRTPVTGTVRKHWPKRELLNEDEILADDEALPRYGKPLPHSAWQVTVEVDERPEWWPYPDTNRFCPSVSELELA